MAGVRNTLLSRLETLREDFLQRFGETDDNKKFIDDLRRFSDTMGGGGTPENIGGKFAGLLETIRRNIVGNRFIMEFEFSGALVQIMALERILAAELARRLGGGGRGEENALDDRMLDRIESAAASMRTLRTMGMDRAWRSLLPQTSP